jgi:hypothetical protein
MGVCGACCYAHACCRFVKPAHDIMHCCCEPAALAGLWVWAMGNGSGQLVCASLFGSFHAACRAGSLATLGPAAPRCCGQMFATRCTPCCSCACAAALRCSQPWGSSRAMRRVHTTWQHGKCCVLACWPIIKVQNAHWSQVLVMAAKISVGCRPVGVLTCAMGPAIMVPG